MDNTFRFLYKDFDITIHYYKKLSDIREVRECLVVIDYSKSRPLYIGEPDRFKLFFDERFNELDFSFSSDDPLNGITRELANYLRYEFNNLKQTDFRYRISDGLESDLTLYLETFLDFLKVENRNNIINQIIQ